MLELMFYGIVVTIEGYMANYIYEFFVKLKVSKHIFVMTYTVTLVLSTYITIHFAWGRLYMRFAPVLMLIQILVFYYGSVWQKIMAFTEANIITLISDIIVTQIALGTLGIGSDIAYTYSFERSICNLACLIIQLPIIYFAGTIQKKIKFSLNKRQWILIIVLLTQQTIAVYIYEQMFYLHDIYIGHIFFAFAICSIVFDIYIFRIMVMMEVKKETEESIMNMSEQNKMIMEYYEDISHKISSLSEPREQYEDKLKEAYKLAGKEYKSKINTDEYKHVQCENIMVDNIITNVCIDLDRMNCTYDINMSVPDTVRMEAMDLASVFINMFDNALFAIQRYISKDGKSDKSKNESGDKSKNKLRNKSDNKSDNKSCDKKTEYHLMAYADYSDGELTVEIKNVKSKSDKVRRLNDIFITTKENKEAHGYGMQIIKRIAAKYNGTMMVEYDDTSFMNRVTLKV